MKLVRILIAAALFALAPAATAAESVGQQIQDLFTQPTGADNEVILDPAEAFRFNAEATAPGHVALSWDVVEGYYLYLDKFSFAVTSGNAAIDTAVTTLPASHPKEDEAFGRVEVVTGMAEVGLTIQREPGPELPITLSVGYQGCKEDSVCYPPITKSVSLTMPALSAAAGPQAASRAELSAEDAIVQRLRESGIAGNLFAFFVFGLVLSLTPCIFPMVPILSGIIVGAEGKGSRGKGFALSLAYVGSMAAGYAILGMLAGALGINLQAASQAPWVLILFSAIFVVLGLSMIGVFQLHMPVAIQSRVHEWSGRQKPGSLIGAAVMGLLSSVIVGPCVAPPLAGALLYISQTGNALLGGAALFVLGLGLGVPLLILGASAGSLLPRAGRWMESVKHVFGVLMFGVAIWFLGRILPGPLTLLLWALLLMTSAIFMGALDTLERNAHWPRLWKGLGIAMLVYGAILIVGAASGGDDPLQPLQRVLQSGRGGENDAVPFKRVNTLSDLRAELAAASAAGTPVMFDFYADWCITCKEMEQKTFTDPQVRALMGQLVLLQADVTANDATARELLDAFELFGPPAILFFDRNAREQRALRVIGFLPPDQFLIHLRAAAGS